MSDIPKPCDCEPGFCNRLPNPFEGHLCRQDAIEMSEALTAAHSTIESLTAEWDAYEAIINDDGSLTTHQEKLEVLADMNHALKTLGKVEALIAERDAAVAAQSVLQSENDALKAKVERLSTPTMYWTDSETMSIEDEYELAERLLDDGSDEEWCEFEVMCARELPKKVFIARFRDSDGGDYEWRWKDAEPPEQQ